MFYRTAMLSTYIRCRNLAGGAWNSLLEKLPVLRCSKIIYFNCYAVYAQRYTKHLKTCIFCEAGSVRTANMEAQIKQCTNSLESERNTFLCLQAAGISVAGFLSVGCELAQSGKLFNFPEGREKSSALKVVRRQASSAVRAERMRSGMDKWIPTKKILQSER